MHVQCTTVQMADRCNKLDDDIIHFISYIININKISSHTFECLNTFEIASIKFIEKGLGKIQMNDCSVMSITLDVIQVLRIRGLFCVRNVNHLTM